MRSDTVAGRLSLPCLFVARGYTFTPLKRMYARPVYLNYLCTRNNTHGIAEDDAPTPNASDRQSVSSRENTFFTYFYCVRSGIRPRTLSLKIAMELVGRSPTVGVLSSEERGTHDSTTAGRMRLGTTRAFQHGRGGDAFATNRRIPDEGEFTGCLCLLFPDLRIRVDRRTENYVT